MAENRLVNVSIVFIAIVILVLVLKTFKSFLRPLALAIILTFLLIPLVKIAKKAKIPAAVTISGVVVLLVFVLYLIGVLVAVEVGNVDKSLPVYQQSLEESIRFFTEKTNINLEEIDIEGYISSKSIISAMTRAIHTTGTIFSEIFLAIVFMVFLIPAYNRIMAGLEKKMGKKRFGSAASQIEKSVRDYLYTKSVVSLGTGILSGIILYFFKADFVVILAILIFVLNYIPNVGSFLGVMLAVTAYLLKFGPVPSVIWLTLLLIAAQVIFGTFLEPKLAGKQLKMSPIVIILSLFVWYWIWGMGGMMLAIPLTSIVRIIWRSADISKKISG